MLTHFREQQSTTGLTALFEMITQWSEACRVPFLIINTPMNLAAKRQVLELSINRHEAAFARVIICDNHGYDTSPSACATTMLTLAKKAARSSSSGGGLQRPDRRSSMARQRSNRNDQQGPSRTRWNGQRFAPGEGWHGDRRHGRTPREDYGAFQGRSRAFTSPYYF